MSGVRRIRLVASGRVQGVGFRRFVERVARTIGVAGWVRNRPDGAVELTAEGSDAALDDLRAQLRRGPPGARVLRLEETAEHDAAPLPSPFTVLHD